MNNSFYYNSSYNNIPFSIKCTFLFLFGLITILAVCGNGIVIWIVLAHRRMRTPTNYFLVNLACADVLNAAFNIPFNGFYMVVMNTWPFGSFMCRCVQTVSHVSIVANVLTYVAISLDRYFAIIHPLRTKLTHKQTLMIIYSIWMLSLFIASPAIISFSQTENRCHVGQTKHYEKYEWFFFSVTYVIPIIVLTITYARIADELWTQTAIGEVTRGQRESIRSKRKVVKMLIAVALIFGICWFPQQLYFIVISIDKSIPDRQATPYIYFISYFFAMSNSIYNPFLYCCMNNRFRNGFRCVFRFCPYIKWSPEYFLDDPMSCSRTVSEPTAMNLVYSSRHRSRTATTANSFQQSTLTDFPNKYNRKN